jgi:hypothetical protein
MECISEVHCSQDAWLLVVPPASAGAAVRVTGRPHLSCWLAAAAPLALGVDDNHGGVALPHHLPAAAASCGGDDDLIVALVIVGEVGVDGAAAAHATKPAQCSTPGGRSANLAVQGVGGQQGDEPGAAPDAAPAAASAVAAPAAGGGGSQVVECLWPRQVGLVMQRLVSCSTHTHLYSSASPGWMGLLQWVVFRARTAPMTGKGKSGWLMASMLRRKLSTNG